MKVSKIFCFIGLHSYVEIDELEARYLVCSYCGKTYVMC